MGYDEAKADGIETGFDKDGFRAYFPRCVCCGKRMQTWTYKSNFEYRCTECKEKERRPGIIANIQTKSESRIRREMAQATALAKKLRALEKAKKIIAKVAKISKYDDAIKWVEDNLAKPGWFQSTEEILTAIELKHRKVNFEHQVKFDRYRVDFLLPDLKVVLEIDGRLFHGKEQLEYSQNRDIELIAHLGRDWEVVHIDAECIDKNVTRLLKAIKTVLERRSAHRAANNGKLPKHYSNVGC